MGVWVSRILNLFTANEIQFWREKKMVNFPESPKSVGWVDGVRCFVLSPKKMFYFEPFPNIIWRAALSNLPNDEYSLQRSNINYSWTTTI